MPRRVCAYSAEAARCGERKATVWNTARVRSHQRRLRPAAHGTSWWSRATDLGRTHTLPDRTPVTPLGRGPKVRPPGPATNGSPKAATAIEAEPSDSHAGTDAGVEAGDSDNAFRIFESMNDHGDDLTAVDLLKSYLLANAAETDRCACSCVTLSAVLAATVAAAYSSADPEPKISSWSMYKLPGERGAFGAEHGGATPHPQRGTGACVGGVAPGCDSLRPAGFPLDVACEGGPEFGIGGKVPPVGGVHEQVPPPSVGAGAR